MELNDLAKLTGEALNGDPEAMYKVGDIFYERKEKQNMR